MRKMGEEGESKKAVRLGKMFHPPLLRDILD
jgi:hypothetical protein